ncbi:uncharacterized protein LOC123553323 [Mercenaria mercenaria]|uniref:uncharacterized protein LOC123553323 n=1 Tax=Mercenaria mercenaria TaxID=6596 RepID=UPI00234EE5CB|nr:uncharacterized protein LOC123553323 [Mercenaria mercenaria]
MSIVGQSLLLFPEGTRWTPEKHAICQKIAKEKGYPEYKHMLLPRTKGFTLSMQLMKGKVFLISAQILPEPLVQYNNRNSVCYGPGTHGQFRPSCPNTDTVIAVQELRVGSKPVEADCPNSVTEWTDHTGSYLVDHSDNTKILNESACCFPDEGQDCTFIYNYTNSGLEYKYHIDSSGYSESKPDMEVSWEKTRCNSTSIYPIGTHFMYMDYSCIKRTKIGDMCSNSTYTTTDGTFYLYNSGYPSSVKATVDFCQCDIQSDAASIQFYTIDLRLKKDGNECKQSLNITDSEGTTTWDCESAPIFNLTKRIHYPVVTATFINDLQIDGGYVWIGVSGDGGDQVLIDCRYQLKEGTIQTTTPIQYTSTAKGPTVTMSTALSSESTFEIHRSTASDERTPALQESTLSASESSFTFFGPTVSISETTFAIHESTFSTYASTSAVIDSTMYTSTTSKYTTPNTQSSTHPYTIVIKDYRQTIIVYVVCGLVVLVLICILVMKICKKATSQVGPLRVEEGTSSGTNSGNRRLSMETKADNSSNDNTSCGRNEDSEETGERSSILKVFVAVPVQIKKKSTSSFESVCGPSSSDVCNSPINVSYATDNHKTAQSGHHFDESSSSEEDHHNKPNLGDQILYDRTRSRHPQYDYPITGPGFSGQSEEETNIHRDSKRKMKYVDKGGKNEVKDSNSPGHVSLTDANTLSSHKMPNSSNSSHDYQTTSTQSTVQGQRSVPSLTTIQHKDSTSNSNTIDRNDHY